MSRRTTLNLLILLTVAAATIAFSLPAIPQTPSYHAFCDSRPLWGIPNFANVASNLPFLIVGLRGLVLMKKSRPTRPIQAAYSFLFLGIGLTGFGSAWYHLWPDNDTLVFDRLPMTIVFMSLVAVVMGETVGAAAVLLPLLLLTGVASVLWWHHTESLGRGDLRLYVLVQYYPPLLITALLLLFPAAGARGWRPFAFAIGWYGFAKVFDVYDCQVFSAVKLSGHTLKHLAAAVSTWYLTKLFIVWVRDRAQW